MPHDLPHARIEAAFHDALWGLDAPAGITAPDASEVAQRFKVYRNNVQHSLTRALAARFPVIEQLVGATFFTAMARAYIAQSPPQDPVMLRWGNSFAGFLDGFPPVAHLPFIGDVARLEYARGRACHAADAAPVAPDALAVAELDALRFILHPSVALFTSFFPAVQIWQAHQPGAARVPLLSGPDHALIARQPDFTVIVARIEPETFSVLAALLNGTPLGRAADNADPTPALTLLLRHGLIIDIDTGVPA
ncbi:HvfC/BufC family peptide modification chaperone [Roseinatronobacter sp. NSM]|uniref:HvfC/BufC family peptide modification chaperone n=1 Tax=Roseinatronobacter sp. NSM TaxID=3457785 RepID=UPI0040350725